MENLEPLADQYSRITPLDGNDRRDSDLFLCSRVGDDDRVELFIQGDTRFRNLVGQERYANYLHSIGAGQSRRANVVEFMSTMSRLERVSDFVYDLVHKGTH